MELAAKGYNMSSIEDFGKVVNELNLVYYASEAARYMQFVDNAEYTQAVKRAMELCNQVNISIDGNFKKIYKCSYEGIENDWKLSVLAYRLVCLNGGSTNPNVATMQIQLLKNQALNQI